MVPCLKLVLGANLIKKLGKEINYTILSSRLLGHCHCAAKAITIQEPEHVQQAPPVGVVFEARPEVQESESPVDLPRPPGGGPGPTSGASASETPSSAYASRLTGAHRAFRASDVRMGRPR